MPQSNVYRIPYLLIFGVLIGLTGCIDEYYPDAKDLKTGTLVVATHLDNGSGPQTITLSRSVDFRDMKYNPVTGCFVQVENVEGARWEFNETEPGLYGTEAGEASFRTGEMYKLVIVTPEGEQYESEFEELHPAPGIKSVYYELEEMPTADPLVTYDGIRFYIDFEIEKDSGRFLQWMLTETYEIQNPNYETQVFGTDRRFRDVPDSEKNLICWITRPILSIYTMDLGGVDGTVYRKMPLNFVSNQTRRLNERYSLLVRQLSLSEKAFRYWNELGKNVQEKGGLFDTQPAIVPGNICNINDASELVIGYFSVSGCSEKRIFVDRVDGLDLYTDPYLCAPGTMPMFLYRYPEERLPLYIATAIVNGAYKTGEVRDVCVDCRLSIGSSNVKPDYW